MRVLKQDEIWASALDVWEKLPSCKIVNAFGVLAKRIAENIVKAKGDNCFLAGIQGVISADVREDFQDTIDGNEMRKDGVMKTFISMENKMVTGNEKDNDELETTSMTEKLEVTGYEKQNNDSIEATEV